MLHGVRIDVLVPAHNEEPHLAGVLWSMPAFVDWVWVIDDGSTDGTASLARSCGQPRVRLVQHSQCLGVGAALRSGYGAAFADGAEVVAVMAGDGQMDPADLTALLAPLLAGIADYSKGNRLGPAVWRHMPPTRLLGNHVLSALTRLATGLPITDSQCGYTALSRKAAVHLPWSRLWQGYGYPNDLLGWAAIAGLRVVDVPVRAVYGSEDSGIRMHHAVAVVPLLLVRVALRRWWYGRPWPQSSRSVA